MTMNELLLDENWEVFMDSLYSDGEYFDLMTDEASRSYKEWDAFMATLYTSAELAVVEREGTFAHRGFEDDVDD